MIVDVVQITSLAASATFVYSFPEKITAPDFVLPGSGTTIAVQSQTTSSVTFINNGLQSESARFFLLWFYDGITRDTDFSPATWQGISQNYSLVTATRNVHESISAAGRATTLPNQGPVTRAYGTLIGLAFTTIATDTAYRMFKIPLYYVGPATFHIHWTKDGDASEAGKNVRWQVNYVVYNGIDTNGATSASTIEIEDTYDDAGTGAGSRIVYRTPNLSTTGFVAGYYVSVAIKAVTPVGTPLASAPVLISLDMISTQYTSQ
jgi:hypothetical protein